METQDTPQCGGRRGCRNTPKRHCNGRLVCGQCAKRGKGRQR